MYTRMLWQCIYVCGLTYRYILSEGTGTNGLIGSPPGLGHVIGDFLG